MSRLAPVLALAAAAALAACATRPPLTRAAPASMTQAAPAPPPRIVRLFVPRPVKCVPDDLGPPPAYPDSDTALRDAGGAADRYQLLAAGRILRQERLQHLEEIVRRCRNAAR